MHKGLMIPNTVATQLGLLPLKRGPVRFAVGSPNGLTSNSWRMWATRHHDVYIACRDNFREAKVSLHATGRWRMGFTAEAVARNTNFLPSGHNRAWEVWDEPPASLPNTVIAFRLLFPTSELAVGPRQRAQDEWKNVVYIEAAPPGKVTVVTLFVTRGDLKLKHKSEPSVRLASLNIGNGRRAQLVAHGDPEGDLPKLIEGNVQEARRQAESAQKEIPNDAYAYFFGKGKDGSRFLVAARMNRGTIPGSSTNAGQQWAAANWV